jgi:hypothetical protein
MFELNEIFSYGLTTDVFLIGSAVAFAIFAGVAIFSSRPSESAQSTKASWSTARS